MCDEITESDNQAYMMRRTLSRREAGLGAGATVTALLTGCTPRPPASAEPKTTATQITAEPSVEVEQATESAPPETSNRMVTIETPDGTAEGFFVAPASGRHPAVLMWPDVAGLRDAFKSMATRLAGEGYAVLVVNQYYRWTKLPLFTTFSEWQSEAGKAKVAPMRQAVTPEGTRRDAVAFVAWLDQQAEVDPQRKVATSGYCMGGPYTFHTAAAANGRVAALASFHGGGLVTDAASSPHTLFAEMQAAALICIAQNDHARAPTDKTTLQDSAAAAGRSASIEVFPAQHGFCVTDSPVYDKPQAERAWAKMLELFKQTVT